MGDMVNKKFWEGGEGGGTKKNWFLKSEFPTTRIFFDGKGVSAPPTLTYLKQKLQSFVMGGWVDGRVGGDLLPPSIFFFFKYDNKQKELLPRTCLKIASAF